MRVLFFQDEKKSYGPCFSSHTNCPYFSDAREMKAWVATQYAHESLTYDQLWADGFRRSSAYFYDLNCQDCAQCIPTRVCILSWRPRDSQRRWYRKFMQDHRVVVQPIVFDAQREELFARYRQHRFQTETVSELISFQESFSGLGDSTLEFAWYNTHNDLVALSVLDIGQSSFSAVYFMWDISIAAYRPGIASIVYELLWGQEQGYLYYYPGYALRSVSNMRYKFEIGYLEIYDGKNWLSFDKVELESKLITHEKQLSAAREDRYSNKQTIQLQYR
jgi:arginyl-tRNA--protein-N-Asp/Glu arginylyltransferase